MFVGKNKSRSQKRVELRIYRKRKKRKVYIRIKNKLQNRPKEKHRKSKQYKKRFERPVKIILILPTIFSFINNPILVLKFFAKFRYYAHEKKNVLLDFRHVTSITPDVIPLLLAKVSKYQKMILISGNRPEKPELDKLLLQSGFYKIVGMTSFKSNIGFLETHKSRIVDLEVAVDARKLTAEKTFDNPNMFHRPLYRTLIECMANTHKHASELPLKESWWLSVYNDPTTKVTSFAFCDTGIGIFKSAKLEKFTKFAVNLGLKSNKDILMRILEGEMESSTGLPYRGKGLPKIFSDYKTNSLRRLCIIANDVFADFDNGTFLDLKDELNGTFLYWEIHPN